jgi:cGMP-dependent protein kinase 1
MHTVVADQGSTITKNARAFARGVLQQSHILSKLPTEQLEQLISKMSVQQCSAGQVIVHKDSPANHVVILQHGECIASKTRVSNKTTIRDLRAVGHTLMVRGDFYGEMALVRRLQHLASIVVVRNNTIILVLSLQNVMDVLGVETETKVTIQLLRLAEGCEGRARDTKVATRFTDLQFHRVVGKGQFGAVRLVTHKVSGEAFALKTIYKQPISDGKQVEHIINEITVMQASSHPFCVQVCVDG